MGAATTPSAPPQASNAPEGTPVVIDTNRVLDLWLFDDPAVAALKHALQTARVTWLATAAMRAELQRVLGYRSVAQQLRRRARSADAVLQAFDRWARVVAPAPAAPMRCADPDDQVFVDLAAARHADLYSRDRAVRALAPRLRVCGVRLPGPLVVSAHTREPPAARIR